MSVVIVLSKPSYIEPCLATPQDTPPLGKEWLHELKFDGFRLQVLKDAARVRLLSRDGYDVARRYPQLALALLSLPARRVLLDAELVAHDNDGRPSFRELLAQRGTLIIWAFDILHLNGRDLRALSLGERKEQLIKLLDRTPIECLKLCEDFPDGTVLLDSAAKFGFGGIISKHRNAPYRSGRSPEWIMVKCPTLAPQEPRSTANLCASSLAATSGLDRLPS
jgi:bifunctional non-homologous end joining protein LigD